MRKILTGMVAILAVWCVSMVSAVADPDVRITVVARPVPPPAVVRPVPPPVVVARPVPPPVVVHPVPPPVVVVRPAPAAVVVRPAPAPVVCIGFPWFCGWPVYGHPRHHGGPVRVAPVHVAGRRW